MNSVNLLLPGGQPSMFWQCGECHQQALSKEDAEKCCGPAPCRYCGKPTEEKYRRGCYSYHVACLSNKRANQEAAWLDKAEKLETWDGWVYAHRGGQDGYFESLDAYVDYLADNFEPAEWPEWVHVAVSRPGVKLDLGDILESHLEDGYDDMGGNLQGEAELEAAIAKFNEANAGLLVWEMDLKRAVRVPRP